ncbi:hypothetical protein HYU92_06145 [Candidatus Curtissbacteria bacterium]|nr:hypothetical protein [Candidatus Curtissbacteria bacterium]
MKRFKIFVLVSFSTLTLAGCVPMISSGVRPLGAQEFLKGQVVPGFPQLPLYEGAKVIESYGYKGSYGASFVTNSELAKVVKFYNDSLPQLGWETSVKELAPDNYVFEIKNEENIGSVIVNTASDNQKTAITMSVSGR